MRTYSDALEVERPAAGSVVSVGVFDGVHLGHQAILAANVRRARELGAAAAVVTFRAHPKQVLLGRAPRTLTSLEHRLELFRRAGIEVALALAFDERLREVPADEFTREILVARLGARAFVLGFDSKFGKDRAGTPAFLRSLGCDVTTVDQVLVAGRAVSSTAIREAIELGDLEGARRMLGRPVSLFGTVVRGDGLGRRLGFPTANLDLHHELHPPPGVYFGRAAVVAAGGLTGVPGLENGAGAVVNIGYRPTLGGERPERPRVEVHLLDRALDLYGATLEVQFLGRLRGEERFPDLDRLAAQIGRDAAAARERLAADPRSGG